MSKTLSGSAIISYGPTLPADAHAQAGALFYKTDASGGNPLGLYMYGFVKDINPAALGSQVAQAWVQVVSPDLFVMKGGDTMLGPLTVPNLLKVTQTGAQRILIGNSGNNPVVIESNSTVLNIGAGTNWSTGGVLGQGLGLNFSLGVTGLSWLGFQVWHAGKMGATSGLDADLLDGQHGAFYLNLSNGAFTGTLPISRGGTGAASTVAGGVVYGASLTALATTPAGTSGQVLISNGSAAPSWTNQSSLSVGFATNANFANSANSATTATTAVLKAGDTMSGDLIVNATVTAGSSPNGRVAMAPGDGTEAGTIEFYTPDGLLTGYIGGMANDSAMKYVSAASAPSHQFTGAIVASGNVTAFSDSRLKTDITPITNALNRVASLEGVTYTRIDTGERHTGLIAQQVQSVLPEAVVEVDGILTVAYGNLVGLLVQAINELKQEVQELKANK